MAEVGAYSKPLPVVTKLNREFWAGGLRGELLLQRCDRCSEFRYPPSPVCPRCLAGEFTWTAVSGTGTLWSWIVFHKRYMASFEADIPYNVALIRLREGPFMLASVVEEGGAEPVCDAQVEVLFERVAEDIALPKFRLVTGEESR